MGYIEYEAIREAAKNINQPSKSQELLVGKGEDNYCTRFDILAYSFLFSIIQPVSYAILWLRNLSIDTYFSIETLYVRIVIESGILGFSIIMLLYHFTNMKYKSKFHVLFQLFFFVQLFGFMITLIKAAGIDILGLAKEAIVLWANN